MKKETPFVKQKRKPITTPNNNTITITTSCLSVDVISLSINRYTYTHILDLNAHQKSSAVDVAFFTSPGVSHLHTNVYIDIS